MDLVREAPELWGFIGVQFVDLHIDGVTMCIEIRDDHFDAERGVHEAVNLALAGSVLGKGVLKRIRKPCTTAEIKINLLKPAATRVLTAHSRIVRAGPA